jgi:arylsulfatase A-like enzyme
LGPDKILGGPDRTRRYKDKLPDAKNLVDRPDFNYTSPAAVKAAGGGHAGYIEAEPPVTRAEAKAFDQEFGDRWRTLMSVDDLVGAVVAALEAERLIDSTYIFYSSDHGFHQRWAQLSFRRASLHFIRVSPYKL